MELIVFDQFVEMFVFVDTKGSVVAEEVDVISLGLDVFADLWRLLLAR